MTEATLGTAGLAADIAGKRIPLASVPVVDFQPFLEGSSTGRAKTVAYRPAGGGGRK